jgi:hypothetical protein
MSNSTNIFDLPVDPVGGGGVSNMNNNITLSASENIVMPPQQQQQTQSQNNNLTLDQNTINQIVNGLQHASVSGATQLPSRDIPMVTTDISTDNQVQPNYVPSAPQNNIDYIKNMENTSDMIHGYNSNMNRQNSLDELYNEIQTPLLISVLYFLFQLPFFRKLLYSYFPILFSKDGNININGYLFTSVLFGILFYLLNKITNHFSTF